MRGDRTERHVETFGPNIWDKLPVEQEEWSMDLLNQLYLFKDG